jgi:pimeloyl-ACP methyl ester carboxylesterase
MQTMSATTARHGHGHGHGDSFSGTKKIRVDGYSVNVSCSGHPAARKPVVVLMAGAGDGLDVVAAHSMGGYIAARYAPDHRDKVKGLVLMDATIPALTAGISKAIPESATGPAADMRAGALAASEGQNPEQLVMDDVKVRSAGRIPVQVIKHESAYAEVPVYGPALEQMWSEGQNEWLRLSYRSSLSTAGGSGHYIYVDRPDIAVKAIQRVTAQATARW